MKQFLLILSAVATLTAYSSCSNKEFICQCTNYRTTDTVRSLVFKTSEKRAETQCKKGNGTAGSGYDCILVGADSATVIN
jgi:hypothetical protein